MAYRYLFHLLGSVTDMYTARKARTVGARGRHRRAAARSWPRRPARCSARPTRSPKRCTWRWWRGATAATPARSRASVSASSTSPRARVRRWHVAVARHRPMLGVDRVLGARRTSLVVDDVSYSLPRRFPALDDVSLTVQPRREGRAARRQRLREVDAAEDARRPRLPRRRHVTPRSAPRSPRTTSRTSSSRRASAAAIGFVFQNSDAQVFSPTVREEIAFGPLNMGLDRDEVDRSRRRHARDARHRRASPTARRTSCRAGRRSGSRSRRCS